jgi:hypothetical protein
VLLSMVVALLIRHNQAIARRLVPARGAVSREVASAATQASASGLTGHVIICGYGR